ncbi:hypothetical protein LF95_13465 [Thalassospira sp. TSL5-1]|nr:hypothetical protein LF95_13465 [Thalassospira sp. TSL5-1]
MPITAADFQHRRFWQLSKIFDNSPCFLTVSKAPSGAFVVPCQAWLYRLSPRLFLAFDVISTNN